MLTFNLSLYGKDVMEQIAICEDMNPRPENEISIGDHLILKTDTRDPDQVSLWCRGVMIRKVDFKDKVSKRLFIIEAVDLGCVQSQLASGLGISRQTIHNYLEIRKHFGLEGLIRGYNPSESASLSRQRKLHSEEQIKGNKAQQVAKIRKKEKEQRDSEQLRIDFDFGPTGEELEVAESEQPFHEEHDWEATRYAGAFIYLITLIFQCRWLNLIMGYFGSKFKIFMIFLLMAVRNIRSVEQLKNVRSREGGAVLGIEKIPSKPTVWQWFYTVSKQGKSKFLKKDYFGYQIRAGLVSLWLWFTDGHLLPYTGREKVHQGYSTQRQMPFPGQTNMVTCDETGRIIDFEIQEGHGDLCSYIKSLPQKWKNDLPGTPLMIFDREGYKTAFFSSLVLECISFVTWDKYVDAQKLSELDDGLFVETFELNNKHYGVFEDEKPFAHIMPDGSEHSFTLRQIYIWNKTSNRRTRGLAWTGSLNVSTTDCARAILTRWGASENTFKHIKDRHPFHYHPGFKLTESEKQEIKNPEIKEKEGLITRCKKFLSRLYKKLTKTEDRPKKDGIPRKNSIKDRITSEIEEKEAELKQLQEEKKELPEKIDVSSLEDYRSFKKIDNEGKNLFDFVTSSVWNARKDMVDWLRVDFDREDEIVDLFYAIADCQGWIKSARDQVIVRLEPLQQPKRRAAQEQLCRKLTNLGAMTPKGKWLTIEVGEAPLK